VNEEKLEILQKHAVRNPNFWTLVLFKKKNPVNENQG
jgi:hypothetical protein